MPPPRRALAAAQSAPAPARIRPCLGHPQGKKKTSSLVAAAGNRDRNLCPSAAASGSSLALPPTPASAEPLPAAPGCCHQHRAVAQPVPGPTEDISLPSPLPWLQVEPPLSRCSQDFQRGGFFPLPNALFAPVHPPALWLLRLCRGRRLARECHFSALAPSCPLRVFSASSPLFAACLLPGAAQGQRRATELSPAAFALPALSCSEISPSRSAVPSRRPTPASSATAMVSSVSPQPSSPPRHRQPVGTELGTAPRHPQGSLCPKTGEEKYPASWGAVETLHHQTHSPRPPELLRGRGRLQILQ